MFDKTFRQFFVIIFSEDYLMKLCVYCGTFNPIHNAHIEVAKYVKANFDFDLILFIPAYKPPHKDIKNDASMHRFNMVKAAISGIKGFEISDIEFKSEENSYTFNTITKLYEVYPEIEGKINFIIGTDAFRKIQTWYRINDLKDLVEFVVFTRENNFMQEDLDNLKITGYNFKYANMPYIDISSTEIRNKIKLNEDISGLVPQSVNSYIKRNGLY